MAVLKRLSPTVIAITCCILLFNSPKVEAGVLKDSFDIAVTVYELYTKAKKEDDDRKKEEAQKRQQEPEGVLHVYTAGSGIVEPLYKPQPNLATAKRKYLKIAMIIQNRCSKPVYIEPNLFWTTRYYQGKIMQQQENRETYRDYDFGKDVLQYDWLKPGQDVEGYVYTSLLGASDVRFSWEMTYQFHKSGENLFESGDPCRIVFH